MAFVQAYGKNDNLFMMHTGNTMGMRGTANTNFAYNALITLNTDSTFEEFLHRQIRIHLEVQQMIGH